MRCFGYGQESTFVSLNQERTGEDPMSNAEEPKAGQWWLHSNGNVMFIAFDERTIGGTETIPILAYAEDLEKSWHRPGEFVRRLPDDAGFDWKPEPEYPQYWTAYGEQYVYLRRVSCDTHRCVKRDGSESGDCDWHGIPHDGRKQLTKQEAEAKLDKPKSIPEIQFDPKTFTSDWGPFEKSAEPDPEELVTQDRVPARIGIDKGWWSTLNKAAPAPDRSWFNVNRNHTGMMHRHKCDDDTVLNLCCRRADLPPLPESKPNRIPVRLYWYDGNVVARYDHTPPTDPSFIEIKLDSEMIISGSGFYVEGQVSP